MIDVFNVAEIVVNHVKERYPDDVALVAYYGSYAQGTAHAKSDLDFFFIPATDRGFQASVQFVLDGIGFDFWPISWTRAERMAAFEEDMVTIIADSKVLYSRSEADLRRFEALKAKVAALCQPERKGEMVGKAAARLKDAYLHLYNLELAVKESSLTGARMEAIGVAASALTALALLNQTFFTRGWGQNLDQVLALKRKPNGLAQLLQSITSAPEPRLIAAACAELVSQTRRLIESEHKVLPPEPLRPEALEGFYEEAKATFDKISAACERGDHPTAFFAGLNIQREVSQFLAAAEGEPGGVYERLGLPDLAALTGAGSLDLIAQGATELDRKLLQFLMARGVRLNLFTTLGEFEAFLATR
ncbi:MAG: hypothetical protein K0R39_3374 [Symbiobacteriaceae bacterium]|jgi:hypothetical protein|nr:hypothetical protein [Symbiobacteriaceae bacterium]